MNNTLNQASYLIRCVSAVAIVLTAVSFHAKKWEAPTLLSQSDIHSVCQAVAGCKSLLIHRSPAADKSHWSTKVTIVADRKVKNLTIQQQVGAKFEEMLEAKGKIFSLGLSGFKTEVRYD